MSLSVLIPLGGLAWFLAGAASRYYLMIPIQSATKETTQVHFAPRTTTREDDFSAATLARASAPVPVRFALRGPQLGRLRFDPTKSDHSILIGVPELRCEADDYAVARTKFHAFRLDDFEPMESVAPLTREGGLRRTMPNPGATHAQYFIHLHRPVLLGFSLPVFLHAFLPLAFGWSLLMAVVFLWRHHVFAGARFLAARVAWGCRWLRHAELGTAAAKRAGELLRSPAAVRSGMFLRKWAGSLSLSGIFLFVAFQHAWLSTHDLDWPYDIDLFRDSAFAHSVMAGKFPEDAYYPGEQNWYNPLPAFLVAGTASLFSTDPIHVYARFGAFVGLIVPVAIFLLGIALFGRWAAACVMFAFLFLRPDMATFYAPTYSPWLYANILALAPMAACIGLALRARTAARDGPWMACGAALGVTFLAHTAAAVIAGSIALAVGFTRDRLATLRRYAVLLVVAFIASLPLAVTILLHYKLKIRNSSGQDWLSVETTLTSLPELLSGALTVTNALAAWGGVVLLRRRSMAGARRVLLTWLGVAGLLLAYAFFRQAVPRWPLPSIVPPSHWLFQLRVARALLAGLGLYGGVVAAATVAKPWIKVRVRAAICMTLLTLLALNYQHFAGYFDFPQERSMAISYSGIGGFVETVDWLRKNTPVDAVILADSINAVITLGSAYRHTVALDPNFSNPYVPIEERARAARRMFAALEKADEKRFRARAAKYGVGYILLADVASPKDRRLAAPFVSVVYTIGDYAVLRVHRVSERPLRLSRSLPKLWPEKKVNPGPHA